MSASQEAEQIDNATPSDNPNNNNEVNQNTNVCKDEVSDISPSSGVSSASSKSTLSKLSGIRPPSRIGRPCGGIQKPAIPATPTKNSSDDSIRRLVDDYGRHRLTDLVEADESEEDGLDYFKSSSGRNRYTSIGSTASSMDGLWELHPRRLSEAGLSRHSDSSAVLTEDTDSFMIGQRVWVGGTKPGTIAYIGETQFAPGDWAGIALDEPIGKNDGSVGGIKYFQCENKKGVFSRLTRLTRVPLEQPGMGSNETFVTTNNGVRRSPISPTGSTKGLLQSAGSLSISNTSLTSSATHVDFKIGDRVIIKSTQGSKIGTVKYMGLTDFAPGEWVGVELDDPRGKNDGSVAGKRYFECRPNFGLFAPVSKVSKSPSKYKPSACVVHSGSGLPPSGLKRANSKESMASMASKTSAASSVRRVRLGVTSLTPKKVSPKTTTPIPTRTALQDVLREKQLHIEQLLKERDLERAEITRAASQADDAEHKLLTLTQEFEKYRAECESKVREQHELLSTLNVDREKLLNQLEDERRRNEDLQFRFEEASISKSDIEENVHAQNAASENYVKQIGHLQANLAEERHKSESLEQTSNKLFEAEESLIKAREEIDALKTDLDAARKARTIAEEKHTASAQLAESLQKHVEGASIDNEEKSKTITKLNEEISKVKDEHEVAKREVENNCKEKDSMIEALKLELENQRNIIEKYEKQHSELVKENEKLKMDLSVKCLDAETGSEQISAKEGEIRVIRDTLEQVKKELSHKSDDLELHKNNSQKVERDLRTELEETRENLKNKISEVENVRKDYHVQLSQKDQQLQESDKKVAQNSDEIKKLTEELDLVKNNFEETKKEIHTRHARQVASQDSQLMALSAELQQKNEEITKASIVISKLEEDLCTKNGVIEKLRLELESYEGRTAAHNETSMSLTQRIHELSLANGDMERQLAIASGQITELSQIKQRLELEIQQLSVKCEGAAQLEQLRNEVITKEQILVSIKQEYEVKIHTLERSRQELELDYAAQVTELERVKHELEAKLQMHIQSENLLQQRCEGNIAELAKVRDEYRVQLNELQQKLQQREMIFTNQEQQNSEIARRYEDQLRTVTDELNRHLQSCQQRISGLTDENLQIKQQLAERSEQLIEAKAEASHAIAQFQQTEKELNQKCADSVRQIEFELNEKTLQLQQTITELQLTKEDCQNTNTDLTAKDHQIGELTAQIKQAQVLVTQLQQELNSVRLMYDQTNKEHGLVQTQCQGLLEQVASLSEQVRNGEQVFKILQVEHNNAMLLVNQLRITEQQKQQCLQQLQHEATVIAENKNCQSVIELLNQMKVDNNTQSTEKVFTLQREMEILRNQFAEKNHQYDVQQSEILRLQQELLKAEEINARCANRPQDSNSVSFDTTPHNTQHATFISLNPLELQIQLTTLKNSFTNLLNNFNALGKENQYLLAEFRNAMNNRAQVISVQHHLEQIIQNYKSVKNTMHVDNYNLQRVVQYSILQLQEKDRLLSDQSLVIQKLQQIVNNLPLQCKPFAILEQSNFAPNECSDLIVDNKKITNLLQVKNVEIVELRKQISVLLNDYTQGGESKICIQQPCICSQTKTEGVCVQQKVPGPIRIVRVVVPVIQPQVVIKKVLVPVGFGQECPAPRIQRIEVPRIIIQKVPFRVMVTQQCTLPDLTALYDCNVEDTLNRLDLSTYNNLEALRFKQTMLSLIGRQRNCIASSAMFCSGLPRFNIPGQCVDPVNIVENVILPGNNNAADVNAYKQSLTQLLDYMQKCSTKTEITNLQQTIQEQTLTINTLKHKCLILYGSDEENNIQVQLPVLPVPEACLSPDDYIARLPLVGYHPSQITSFKDSLIRLLLKFQNCQISGGVCNNMVALPQLPSIQDCIAPPEIINRLRLESFPGWQSDMFRRTLLQLLLTQRQCASGGSTRVVEKPVYIRVPVVVPKIIPQKPKLVIKPILVPVPQPPKVIQVPVPQGSECKMSLQQVPIRIPFIIRVPIPVAVDQSCQLPNLNVFDCYSTSRTLASLDLSCFDASNANAFKQTLVDLIQRTCNSGVSTPAQVPTAPKVVIKPVLVPVPQAPKIIHVPVPQGNDCRMTVKEVPIKIPLLVRVPVPLPVGQSCHLPNLNYLDCYTASETLTNLDLSCFNMVEANVFKQNLLNFIQQTCHPTGFIPGTVPQEPKIVMKPVLVPVPQPPKIIQVPVPQGTDCKMTVQQIPIRVPVIIRVPVPVNVEKTCQLPNLNVFDCYSPLTILSSLDLSCFDVSNANAFKQSLFNLIKAQRGCSSGESVEAPVPPTSKVMIKPVLIPVPQPPKIIHIPVPQGSDCKMTIQEVPVKVPVIVRVPVSVPMVQSCHLPNLNFFDCYSASTTLANLDLSGYNVAEANAFKQTLLNFIQLACNTRSSEQVPVLPGGNQMIIGQVPQPCGCNLPKLSILAGCIVPGMLESLTLSGTCSQAEIFEFKKSLWDIAESQKSCGVPLVRHVPVAVPRIVVKEVVKEVPRDVIRQVKVPVYQRIPIQVPYPVEKIVVKEVKVPVYQRVPFPVVVPKEVIRRVTVKVPVPVPQIIRVPVVKTQQVRVPVAVPHIVPVPKEVIKEVLREVKVPVRVVVPGPPQILIKQIPIPQPPRIILKHVPVLRDQPARIISVPSPPQIIVKQVPVQIPVPVKVPVYVTQKCHLPLLNLNTCQNLGSIQNQISSLILSGYDEADVERFKQRLLETYILQRNCYLQGQCRPRIVQVPRNVYVPKEVVRVLKVPVYQKVPVQVAVPVPQIVRYPVTRVVEVPKQIIKEVFVKVPVGIPGECHLPIINLGDCRNVQAEIQALQMPGVDPWEAQKFKQALFISLMRLKDCFSQYCGQYNPIQVPMFVKVPLAPGDEEGSDVHSPGIKKVKIPVPLPLIFSQMGIREVPKLDIRVVRIPVRIPFPVQVPSPPQVILQQIPVPVPQEPKVIIKPIVVPSGENSNSPKIVVRDRIVRVPSPPQIIFRQIPVRVIVPVKVPVLVKVPVEVPVPMKVPAIVHDPAQTVYVRVPVPVPRVVNKILQVPIQVPVPVPVPQEPRVIVQHVPVYIPSQNNMNGIPVPSPQVIVKQVAVRIPVPVKVPFPVHIPVRVPVERQVRVPIHVPVPVQVPVEYPRIQIREVKVPVPVEVPRIQIKEVRVPVRISVPVEVPKIQIREVRVPVNVPYPVRVTLPPKILVKQVPIPIPQRPEVIVKQVPIIIARCNQKPRIIMREKQVPVIVPRPVLKEVPVYVKVRMPVEVPVRVPFPVPVEIPKVQIKEVRVPVQIPVPVRVPVVIPKIQIREVRVPVRIPVEVPRIQVKEVRIPVQMPVRIPVEVPKIQIREVRIPMPVRVQVPVEVPRVQIREVKVPVNVPYPVRIPLPPKILVKQVPILLPQRPEVIIKQVPIFISKGNPQPRIIVREKSVPVVIPRPVLREVPVYVKVQVPVQVPVRVPVPVEVPKIHIKEVRIPFNIPVPVQVPVVVPKIQTREVRVPVRIPVEVLRVQIKEVRVPVQVPVPYPVEVPKIQIHEVRVPVQVPVGLPKIQIREVRVPVRVPVPVQVPVVIPKIQIREIKIPVNVPYPVRIPLPPRVLVKQVPVPIPQRPEVIIKQVPIIISNGNQQPRIIVRERPVPVVVPRPVLKEVPIYVKVQVPVQVPVRVPVQVPVVVTKLQIREVRVPFNIPVPIKVPVELPKIQIREVRVPVRVPVQVPIQVPIEVPKIQIREVRVPVRVPVQVPIQVPVEVPKIQIREVKVPVNVPYPVRIPLPPKILIKQIPVPVPQRPEVIIKQVPILISKGNQQPRIIVREKPVPVIVSRPVLKEVPVYVRVQVPVQVPVRVPVQVPVEVPKLQIREVRVPFNIPVPVKVPVEVPRIQIREVRVPVQVPYPVEVPKVEIREIRVPVQVPVGLPKIQIREVRVPIRVPVPVQVPVVIPKIQIKEIKIPVNVPYPVRIPLPPRVLVKQIPVPIPQRPEVIIKQVPIYISQGNHQPRVIVRERPVPVVVSRPVLKEVPVYVKVQVPVPVPVRVPVQVPVEVPKLQIREVRVPFNIPVPIKVPVEVPKIQIREVRIPVRIPVQVPVEVPKIQIREIRVPVQIPVQVPVEVPRIIIKEVRVPVQVPIQVPVEVPKIQIREVRVPVNVPYPVRIPLPPKVLVKQVAVPVPQRPEVIVKQVPIFISKGNQQPRIIVREKPVPVIVSRPVIKEVPVYVKVQVPVQVPVRVQVPVEIPKIQIREIRVPVNFPVPVQVPVAVPKIQIMQVKVPVRIPIQVPIEVPRIQIKEVRIPVQVPVPYPVEVPKIQIQEVRVPVQVPVALPRIQIREVRVPVRIPVPVHVRVEVPKIQIREIKVPVNIPVPVEVPKIQIREVRVPVNIPYPVRVPLPPKILVKQVPVPVPQRPEVIVKQVPIIIARCNQKPRIIVKEKSVPVFVPRPVIREVPVHIKVPVQVPVEVRVPVQVPVMVPNIQVREVRIPVRVPVPIRIPIGVPQIQTREIRVPVRIPVVVKIPVEIPKVQIREIRVPVPEQVPPKILFKQVPVLVPQRPQIIVKQVPIYLTKCDQQARLIVKEKPVPVPVPRVIIKQVPIKVPVAQGCFVHLPELSAIGNCMQLQAQIEGLVIEGFNQWEVQKFKQDLFNLLLRQQNCHAESQIIGNNPTYCPVQPPVEIKVPVPVGMTQCHLPNVNLGDCQNLQGEIEALQIQGVDVWEVQKFKQDLFTSFLRLKNCITPSFGPSINVAGCPPAREVPYPVKVPVPVQVPVRVPIYVPIPHVPTDEEGSDVHSPGLKKVKVPLLIRVPVPVPVPVGSECRFPVIHITNYGNLHAEIQTLQFPGCNEWEVQRFKQNLLDILTMRQSRVIKVPVDRIVRVPIEIPKVDIRVVRVPFRVPVPVKLPSAPQIIIKQIPVPVPQAPKVIVKPILVPQGDNLNSPKIMLKEKVVRVPSPPQIIIRQVPVRVTVPVKVPVPVQVPVEVPVPVKVPFIVHAPSQVVNGDTKIQCHLPNLNINGCWHLEAQISALPFPDYNPYQVLEFKQNLLRLLLGQRDCILQRPNGSFNVEKPVYIRQAPVIVYQKVPVNVCSNGDNSGGVRIVSKQVPIYIRIPVPVLVPRIVEKIIPKRILQQVPVPQAPQIIEKPVPIPIPSPPQVIVREVRVPVLNGVSCPAPRVEIQKIPVLQPPQIITKPILVPRVIPLIKQISVPYPAAPIIMGQNSNSDCNQRYYASQLCHYKRIAHRLQHILRRYLNTGFTPSRFTPIGRSAVPLPMLHVMKSFTPNLPLIPVQLPSNSIGFNSEAFVVHLHQAYKHTQEALSHCMDAVLAQTLSVSQLKSTHSNSQQLIEDREQAENQIRFLNSIIVDIQKKNEEQKARIEILEAGCSPDFASDLGLIGSANRQIPPRMYCDICEEFDLHETEDCPKQVSEEIPLNGQRERRDIPDRPYCEICEEFGHATEDCKEDQTF